MSRKFRIYLLKIDNIFNSVTILALGAIFQIQQNLDIKKSLIQRKILTIIKTRYEKLLLWSLDFCKFFEIMIVPAEWVIQNIYSGPAVQRVKEKQQETEKFQTAH